MIFIGPTGNAQNGFSYETTEFIRQHGVFPGKPFFDGAHQGIREKLRVRFHRWLICKQICQMSVHNRKYQRKEIFGKRILPFHPECLIVKIAILVKIAAHIFKKAPGRIKLFFHRLLDKLRIINPVDQFILVFKMVIKAFTAQSALTADISHADFLDGLCFH